MFTECSLNVVETLDVAKMKIGVIERPEVMFTECSLNVH
jgi:hypothetical protein